MTEAERLLNLAVKVAKKARKLIPRSANRVIKGYAVNGLAVDSDFGEAGDHVLARLLAQRSRKSLDDSRRRIDRSIEKLSSIFGWEMRGKIFENAASAEVTNALKEFFPELMGKDAETFFHKLIIELDDRSRGDKTHHRAVGNAPPKQFMPMEQLEADAKNAVRYRVGNCGENASLAMVMFAEYPGPDKDDDSLPDVDIHKPERNPLAEYISLKKPYDHAFVVLNRPDVDPKSVDDWLIAGVVICDPWWFHSGDAFLANSPAAGDQAELIAEIRKAAADGLIVRPTAVHLGQMHSPRFLEKEKYKGLNYYQNDIETTVASLRAEM